MSQLALLGILLAIGGFVAFLLLRRKPDPVAHPPPQAPITAGTARDMLLQIVIPETGACCAAARRIETHRFHKQLAPPLPLADCSMKNGCHCRYQPVPDRRIGERRKSDERRQSYRFEGATRRDRRGRRGTDGVFDDDAE